MKISRWRTPVGVVPLLGNSIRGGLSLRPWPGLSLALFACVSLLCVYGAVAQSDPLSNWHWRNPLPQGNDLQGVAYGNGIFVVVGGGAILTSSDGVQWTQGDFKAPARLTAATYGNGLFVAAGWGSVI